MLENDLPLRGALKAISGLGVVQADLANWRIRRS
jgi:hypothetical protein